MIPSDSGSNGHCGQEVPTRATILNQRMIMKQLQQEFAEAGSPVVMGRGDGRDRSENM